MNQFLVMAASFLLMVRLRSPSILSLLKRIDYWQESHIIELIVGFKTVSRRQGRRFSF